jgi:hypothetical protein
MLWAVGAVARGCACQAAWLPTSYAQNLHACRSLTSSPGAAHDVEGSVSHLTRPGRNQGVPPPTHADAYTSAPHARSPGPRGYSLSLKHIPLSAAPPTHARTHARTSTHATLQVRLHRAGRPAPTPVSPSPLVQVRGQRRPQWHHVTALLSRPQPRAAVAAWPSSTPCCRSTPAPAQLFLGGGASRWRPGSRGRSAASPLFSTHARLTLAGFLSLSNTRKGEKEAPTRRHGP